jgi:hypothetical protein
MISYYWNHGTSSTSLKERKEQEPEIPKNRKSGPDSGPRPEKDPLSLLENAEKLPCYLETLSRTIPASQDTRFETGEQDGAAPKTEAPPSRETGRGGLDNSICPISR